MEVQVCSESRTDWGDGFLPRGPGFKSQCTWQLTALWSFGFWGIKTLFWLPGAQTLQADITHTSNNK